MNTNEQMIVVVDNGFVFVGETHRKDNDLWITNAKNVRKWGTTKGLGQLRSGPTKDTALDDYGDVIIPWIRVVFMMPVKWK